MRPGRLSRARRRDTPGPHRGSIAAGSSCAGALREEQVLRAGPDEKPPRRSSCVVLGGLPAGVADV
eukprot:11194242-Lingulodinium_polyedra.AAC.1